ncbi:hypothetical protein KVR01_010574 [Diaporthe batatas]|uniref:uncharacterized protein n=1 Tax=Diaporthe batatas TaxID=748121 RepID=UPI001D0389A5|nr:uncharacterized protein KVR01_010574 [Diaporthe batatas]KAG8159937.1 hypothetical protein KVR01_010574 [Diaporthe batatas]
MASENEDWLICTACGTQYPTADRQQQTRCFICDDPRQFTPPSGQSFTTLGSVVSSLAGYKNVFHRYDKDDRLTFIYTAPKFAIGQRAILIRTPAGNILWDCITLLDHATVQEINRLGGLKAIVISHPHYYTNHLQWARAFGCPVYLAAEDKQWLAQTDPERQVFLEAGTTEQQVAVDGRDSGATILKLGGHFPGSLVLLFDGRLFVADTLLTTPAGLGSWEADAVGNKREGHLGRPQGANSFAFMWSIPNMIPLSPEEIWGMWNVLGQHEFRSTHGAFMGQDIEDEKIKARVLWSAKIQVSRMGWKGHGFLLVSE